VAVDDVGLGMRCMLQRVVVGRPVAQLDLADLFADADHRGNEAVEFGFDSDSVGSTIIVPATGKLTVGA
jgi:hypothetical protein